MQSQSKINYQNKTDAALAALPDDRVPTLFLHACCAPCSSYVLEYLSRYFAITLFFYNPNIALEAEYQHRREELRRLVRTLPTVYPVQVVDGDYLPERFFVLAKGAEDEPERGARCQKCIRHRLEETFRTAAALEQKPDFVCTTLSISPHKDAVYINSAGAELAVQYVIPWLYADFKKKGGYQRSITLSREYALYRQDFCGCVYSKATRDRMR
ncbi:MAG: epoxyqueuosine reductase QueH [Ruminococcus sp.]|nr:epoxyqueuosine reductase QueH [Ruminococcus sp.]